MAKYLEPRRHTDDDALSAYGVRQALGIDAGLQGDYDVAVSDEPQRSTQTLACFLAALGRRCPAAWWWKRGLRSKTEERWKAAYQEAGSGVLHSLRSADLELVEQDSTTLGPALRGLLDIDDHVLAPLDALGTNLSRPIAGRFIAVVARSATAANWGWSRSVRSWIVPPVCTLVVPRTASTSPAAKTLCRCPSPRPNDVDGRLDDGTRDTPAVA